MLKTYANQAAYEAAEKSKIESAVSLIESTGKAVFDGVNVVTDNPGIGDILCYDENRKYKFIQLDTFQAGTFPSAWETVGVVVLRKGNKVTVCSKHNASKKFMEVYPYVVSGYELDGTEHTAQLRLHSKPSTSTYYDFIYSASTDEEFVSQLQQFLTDNGETDWSAYLMDGNVILQYHNYIDYEGDYWTSAMGITLRDSIKEDLPEIPYFKRKCGNRDYCAWNIKACKQRLKEDINAPGYNPSSDLSSVPSYPVCYPAFCGTSQYQDDHCLYLRQRYCKDPDKPTLAEWEAYIDSLAPILPWMTAGAAPEYRDEMNLNGILKGKEYKAADGSQKKLYPGIVYCAEFLGGKGYLPSMAKVFESFQNNTYGLSGVTRKDSDPINRSLYVIGGDSLTCHKSYPGLGRIPNSELIFCFWAEGYVDNNQALNSITFVPFADIDLKH